MFPAIENLNEEIKGSGELVILFFILSYNSSAHSSACAFIPA